MEVENLRVEKWTEDVTYINKLTGKEEFTKKNAKREQWFWEVDGIPFHTDKEGCGLWRNGVQTAGTCQFSLAGYSIERARKRLNRRVQCI